VFEGKKKSPGAGSAEARTQLHRTHYRPRRNTTGQLHLAFCLWQFFDASVSILLTATSICRAARRRRREPQTRAARPWFPPTHKSCARPRAMHNYGNRARRPLVEAQDALARRERKRERRGPSRRGRQSKPRNNAGAKRRAPARGVPRLVRITQNARNSLVLYKLGSREHAPRLWQFFDNSQTVFSIPTRICGPGLNRRRVMKAERPLGDRQASLVHSLCETARHAQ
jgi:hypothetical protein